MKNPPQNVTGLRLLVTNTFCQVGIKYVTRLCIQFGGLVIPGNKVARCGTNRVDGLMVPLKRFSECLSFRDGVAVETVHGTHNQNSNQGKNDDVENNHGQGLDNFFHNSTLSAPLGLEYKNILHFK